MKFLEIVGKASTTAYFKGRRVGRNVNCAAYINDDGVVIVKVESNSAYVRGTKVETFDDIDAYEGWKEMLSERGKLFNEALVYFGLETTWSK